MEKLNELMKHIKKRPGMYVGSKSLTRLGWFFEGYVMCAKEIGDDSYIIFDEFRDFVEKKYRVSEYKTAIPKSYVDVIMLFERSEESGVDTFFELYEQFAKSKRFSIDVFEN